MKKIILFAVALLLLAPLEAKDLKVLLDSRKTLDEFNFLENYAIVINKDHYYGPISKDNRLKIEIADGGKLRLWVRYVEKDKNNKEQYKYKNLGTTSSQVDIVRGFENKTDFSQTIDPKNATSKTIDSKYVNLSKQMEGAPESISLVMPVSSVIFLGMTTPSSMKVSKRATTCPSTMRTAPISMMSQDSAFRPVVSMSKATYSPSMGKFAVSGSRYPSTP